MHSFTSTKEKEKGQDGKKDSLQIILDKTHLPFKQE
jgi:hypothetical protein